MRPSERSENGEGYEIGLGERSGGFGLGLIEGLSIRIPEKVYATFGNVHLMTNVMHKNSHFPNFFG